MGDNTNLMEITGVMRFEDPISYEELVSHFEERLLPFGRFRQRITGRDFAGRPRWETDPDFDLESHVHHVALPEPQDTDRFQRFIADVMSRPIDATKPPWQAYLVDGAGQGNALVIAIHHSIADGFALMYVLMGLADDPRKIEYPVESMPDPPSHVREEPDDPAESAGDDPPAPDHSPSNPSQPLGETVRRGIEMARTAYDVLTLDEEPDTPLVGELGVQKRVAWTDPVPLDRIKAAGKPYEATINDVILVAVAGALRRHLEAEGVDVDDTTLRCTVPVNLKPIHERTEDLGNYFGLGFVELPVGVPGFAERIDHIHESTGELRQGTEAFLLYQLLRLFGRGPPTLQKLALKVFENKATTVVTNVPGPTERFTIQGHTVEDIFFWVPQSNGVGLGLSVFSYDGALRVGVAADANLLPEPFDLAEAFEAELSSITADAPTPTTD